MSAAASAIERRAELTAAEAYIEKVRQGTQHERRLELDAKMQSREDHARNVDGALTARSRILEELRSVRTKVQEKLIHAQAKGVASAGAAERALARAGQRALSAKQEADRAQAFATEEEARRKLFRTTQEEHLAKVRHEWDARVAEADTHAAERSALAQRNLDEASLTFDKLRQRQGEDLASQASHAERCTSLKLGAAQVMHKRSMTQVDTAARQLVFVQIDYTRKLQRKHADANTRVQEAQKSLAVQQAHVHETLDVENICAAQARLIATSLVQQEEAARVSALVTLDSHLDFVASQVQRKATNYDEERQIVSGRRATAEVKAAATASAAQAHSDAEASKARVRVEDAKRTLSDLHAQCAAYLRDIEDRRDEAKCEDAAKIEAARARTEALKQYCDRTLASCRSLWDERVSHAAQRQEEAKQLLEAKVLDLSKDAVQRAEMKRRQARELRLQVEGQLRRVEEHIEDLRARCAARVQADAETAAEKVHLALLRHHHRTAAAAERASECQAKRAAADAEYIQVMAQAAFAAAECRRRGLDDIADIIDGEEHAQTRTMTPTFGEDEVDETLLAANARIQSVQRERAEKAASHAQSQSQAQVLAGLEARRTSNEVDRGTSAAWGDTASTADRGTSAAWGAIASTAFGTTLGDGESVMQAFADAFSAA